MVEVQALLWARRGQSRLIVSASRRKIVLGALAIVKGHVKPPLLHLILVALLQQLLDVLGGKDLRLLPCSLTRS